MQRGQERWAIVRCILTSNVGKPRISDVVYTRNGVVDDYPPIGHYVEPECLPFSNYKTARLRGQRENYG